jgi:5-hydroxyisourate hydrolase
LDVCSHFAQSSAWRKSPASIARDEPCALAAETAAKACKERWMSGRLTTHVLDLSAGRPAGAMEFVLSRIEVHRLDDDRRRELKRSVTNADGRCDEPLLQGEDMAVGHYELIFFAGRYFRQSGIHLPEPAFLEEVPIRFGIADANMHYHVPLLVSPYGYSTYRGS